MPHGIKSPRPTRPQEEYNQFKSLRSYKWTAEFVKFVSEFGMPPDVYNTGASARGAFNRHFKECGGRYQDGSLFNGLWTEKDDQELTAILDFPVIRKHGMWGCSRRAEKLLAIRNRTHEE